MNDSEHDFYVIDKESTLNDNALLRDLARNSNFRLKASGDDYYAVRQALHDYG